MDEQRKFAILFAATILAARKLNECGSLDQKLGRSVVRMTCEAYDDQAQRLQFGGGLAKKK